MGITTVNRENYDDTEIPLLLHTPPDHHLDAGTLFVLKSKGSWLHCGYHLTASIVAPSLLTLPYAISLLGWTVGATSLAIGALVTFYSYNLISVVLEHHAQFGRRQLRFRDMADHILGLGWGRYFVGPIQFVVCYGCIVGCILLSGTCMKIIDSLLGSDEIELYKFTMISGALMLALAQIPSFHSLRYISLMSLLLSLMYCALVVGGSIYAGNSSTSEKDYAVSGDIEDRVLGTFNAIGIIATSYGNGIIPEIQATVAAPVKGKMFKGLCVCYTVVIMTFFSVAVSCYWSFGNKADSFVINNLADVLPGWFVLIIVSLIMVQVSAVGGVYLQPINEVLETTFIDPSNGQFSALNVLVRVATRSLSTSVATMIAVMLPFFADLNALLGAVGFLPLDFILPSIFFNVTFKPSKRNPVFWVNSGIVVVFSLVVVIAVFAAVRQIIVDAKDYHFFS